MQELLLFSSIPAARHDQVLNILAGVSAMQPVPLCEQTLIYRQLQPTPAPTKTKSTTAPQQSITSRQQRLHYQKLIRDIQSPSSNPTSIETTPQPTPWRLRTESLPDAGTKTVNSRPVTEIPLTIPSLDPFRGGPSSTHKYISQYILSGYQLIYANSVILRMFRVLIPPEGTGALEPLDAPVVKLEECSLKDPSGAWMISASVRVEDGGEARVVEEGVGRLLGCKRLLEGSVDLRVGERLCLDTRV